MFGEQIFTLFFGNHKYYLLTFTLDMIEISNNYFIITYGLYKWHKSLVTRKKIHMKYDDALLSRILSLKHTKSALTVKT